MNKTRLYTIVVSSLILIFFCRLEAASPPEATKPVSVALSSMTATLKRIGDAPSGLPAPEEVEFKKLLKGGTTAVATLARRIGNRDVPEDYLNGIAAANAAYNRIGAKPTQTKDDLVLLRALVKDIEAKRRWAEKNKDAPAGPMALDVAAKKSKQPVDGLEVWFRSAIDEQLPPVQGGALGAGETKVSLPPGNYFFWLRAHGSTAHEGAKHEFAADGAPARVELAPPEGEPAKKNARSAKEKMN